MNDLKKISKKLPWLIPGVGTQGGSLEKSLSIENGDSLSIINVSRDIIYSGNGTLKDIKEKALYYTKKIQEII